MPMVSANGIRFHTMRVARLAAGEEPSTAAAPPPTDAPVVFVHGLFTGSVASWLFTCVPTVQPHRDAFVYDLRGHGCTDRPAAGYDLATMVADLDALTGDFAPFDLVGHSYGAQIALRFALTFPERVRSLALVELPLPADGDPAPYRPEAPDFDLDAWLRVHDTTVAGDDSALRRRLRVARKHVGSLVANTSILADLRAERPVSDTDLGRLGGRTMFVFGSRSPFAGAAQRLARVRPDLECRILSGGHAIHVDATAELASALERLVTAPAPVATTRRPVRVLPRPGSRPTIDLTDHRAEAEHVLGADLIEVP